MNFRKFLFPYSKQNTNLKHYWWHRLLVVIFLVFLITIPIYIFWGLNGNEIKSRDNCLSLYTGFAAAQDYNTNRFEPVVRQQMELERNKASYDINFYNSEQTRLKKEWDDIYKEIHEGINNCYTSYPIHNKLNLGLGLLSAILVWYLLQTVYYKIIIYVIIDNSNKNN